MQWWRDLRNWLADRIKAPPAETEAHPVDGTDTARGATWHDVYLTARLMEKHGVEYALIGGYGLAYNGLVRQTGDVDFIVRDTVENNRRWVAAMCDLPRGQGKALLEFGDEPFPNEPPYDDESRTVRIVDEFVVDILPTACGWSYEDLQGFMRLHEKDGLSIRVLDLAGLRLTKQGMRDKDRSDLFHIEATLKALDGDLDWHAAAMDRRHHSAEPPPRGDAIVLRLPDDDAGETESRTLAEAVFDRAARAGGEPDVDVDTLALYGDRDSLLAALREEPPVTELRAFLEERGVSLPRHGG
ncbi:hypothetical protein [Methylobacterium oryzae]|uniref:Nucleotidyltransferase family protein n=1 Tax=Methylobacterium oryzae TaxID=334852 RepID=A0ABU7TLF9_9HYPH